MARGRRRDAGTGARQRTVLVAHAEVVDFAERDAAAAHDPVGGDEVEVEVRRREPQEVPGCGASCRGRADRKVDRTIISALELLRRQRREKLACEFDLHSQRGTIHRALECGRDLEFEHAAGGLAGEVADDLYLPIQRKHVRIEPSFEYLGFGDRMFGGVGKSLLQDARKAGEAAIEHTNTGRVEVGFHAASLTRHSDELQPIERGTEDCLTADRAECEMAALEHTLIRNPMARLAIASACALFLELACIRWAGSHVLYLSYVSNLVLIAAFFGLGLGAMWAGTSPARTIERWISATPAWLMLLVCVISIAEFEVHIDGAQAVYFRNAREASELPAWVVLPLLGTLITGLFVSLGFAVGRELRAAAPLVAYSVDILGSLIGIVAFAVVSWASIPAQLWFLAGSAGVMTLMPARRMGLAVTALLTLVTVSVVTWRDADSTWSPYQRVSVLPLAPADPRAPSDPTAGTPSYRLRVNNVVHQYISDVRRREPFYEFPYRAAGATLPSGARSMYLTATPPHADWVQDPFVRRAGWHGRVAIIGAGNGTDTAAALAYGAGHVDSVEIDPLLAAIGRELQPNRPFADPRTRVHIMDGRTFLERARDPYDIVVFGLPDSVTLASPYAGLRLESFLFTEQSFARALHAVDPNHGLVVAYNYYRTRWLVDRIANTLQRAAGGEAPVVWVGPDRNLSALFIAGPGAKHVDPNLARDWGFKRAPASAAAIGSSTDDWPFLYLRERAVPQHIVITLAILLGLGTTGVVWSRRRMRQSHPTGTPASVRELAPFFFMGAAFLLLETSGLVRMSLLFGATWFVNALVFAGVLVMVLLANLLAARLRLRGRALLPAVLLLASLAIAWLVPPSALSAWAAVPKYALSTALWFVPVLLGNLSFSLAFRDSHAPAQAFGANLLGAVVGGALENLALLWGYRALFLVAGALYCAAYLTQRRGSQR